MASDQSRMPAYKEVWSAEEPFHSVILTGHPMRWLSVSPFSSVHHGGFTQ